MPIDFTGITNQNEFYTHHYLAAIFEKDIAPLTARWQEQVTPPWDALRGLAKPFQTAQEEGKGARSACFLRLFEALGYGLHDEIHVFDDGPVIHLSGHIRLSNGRPELWLLEAGMELDLVDHGSHAGLFNNPREVTWLKVRYTDRPC